MLGDALAPAKLVLLGDMGAGKSSLVLRFVKGQFHDFQVGEGRVRVCARGRGFGWRSGGKKTLQKTRADGAPLGMPPRLPRPTPPAVALVTTACDTA